MTAWPVAAQYRPARGRPVLAEWLLPRAATRSGATIVAAAALTAVAAQIAVPIPGYGARRGADRSSFRTLAVFVLASAVIYLIGTTWLCLATGMSASGGISAGVVPFLPGDAVKALLAAVLLPGAWRLAAQSPDRKDAR
jgi:biotin transport system substrate-specific component